VRHSSPEIIEPRNASPSHSIPTASKLPQGGKLLQKTLVANAVPKLVPNAVPCKINDQLSQQVLEVVGDTQSGDPLIVKKRVVKRTSSCPPGRVRSATSGPWSLEW